MNGIYLLLGTNNGDKLNQLQNASKWLTSYEIEIVRSSSIYESEPWGIANQDWFLNMVLEIATHQNEQELLGTILDIEKQMGRIRDLKWGPRLIDIDILYYENVILATKDLTIPHPEIQNRRFTLLPLAELARDEIHPLLKQNHKFLLDNCPDNGIVNKTNLSIS